MTYKELYESAIDKLEKSKITLGEFEKMIAPLNAEIATADSDTISRAKAIEALRAMQTYKLFAGDDMLLIDQAGAQTELMMLQPAQPERIKGHWIKISPANIYECSECGKSVMTSDICAYDFCHGCGAKMEREVTE